MKWFFTPQLSSQVETEVTQRDQFSNDEVQLSETIIRESIQNSLDAADTELGQLKVSFRWVSGVDGLDAGFVRSILDQQLDHARATNLDVDAVELDSPTALIIEDFGTCGLTGSVNSKDDDNFSDFWRRHGKSHKTGKSRGRWGLGKLVYSTSSQLGVFFGATLRLNDPQVHVMGQTVLNLRKVNGTEYPPHGFFADTEGEGDIYKTIPVPLKDPDLVNDFIRNFSLQREGKTGLSVIIPFPNPDFSVEHMIRDAIKNYFYSLITGQLVLQFNDIGINSENVRQLAHEYASDSFSDIDKIFDFVEEATSTTEDDLLALKHSWADDARLDEDDFEPEVLDTIRERFGKGELVALYLPVIIKQKDNTKHDTGFSVFIKRPAELERGLDLYVRGGLTLPGEAKFRERKALGAMVADEEAICSFLGDAENAAHTQWIGSAEKLRNNWKAPQKIVKVIKNSVVQLYDLLAEVMEEVDERALQNFFSLDEPDDGKPGKKNKPKSPIDIPPPPEPRPKDFIISSKEGGFTVSTTKSTNSERFPQNVRIDVAYDLASGNPFKKYNPLDFRIGANGSIELALSKDTGKVLERKDNIIRMEVTDMPFRMEVKGFDPNRDLKIRLVKEG